jgi:sugar lactone lactonase YvrE
MTAKLVWDLKCGTGESLVWDAANNRLLFCDIPEGRIHAFSLADGARRTWQLPEVVGSFGLCVSGRLIVALRHRVVFYDLESETITPFAGPVDEPASNRFNDGKVGPDGSFWVGSMDQNTPREATGHLYRVTPDGIITRKASGFMVSNGLAWSPDGRTMYHSCSGQSIVWAWDHHNGEISNRRVFAELSETQGRPDGAAMDAQGCYWSAGVSGGHLNQFAPDGTLLATIAVPASAPTMPCFTPDWLYFTSLRRAGTPDDSPDGGLFRLPTNHAGAPIPAFADI